MKEGRIKIVTICDVCEKESYGFAECLGCGKDICCECKEKGGKDYNYGLRSSGSNDGYYCEECEKNPEVLATPLHFLYNRVLSIQKEYKAITSRWRNQSKELEEQIVEIRNRMREERKPSKRG